MNDLEEIELSGERSEGRLERIASPRKEPTGSRPPWWAWLAVLAVVVVAVGAVWWWRRGVDRTPLEPPAAESMPPAPAAPTAEVATGGEETVQLPALNASDTVVRELVGALSAHPAIAEWLVTDDLIRRFVVAVVNVAEGESPRTHLEVVAPREAFAADRREGKVFLGRESFSRYDAMTEAFLSLDVRGSVELYRRLEPLVDEAYRDLGYPGRDFDDALRRAAEVVLSTPRIEGEIELEPGVRSFRFADESLESLPGVHKQLLRLGLHNLGRLQSRARELLDELEETGDRENG